MGLKHKRFKIILVGVIVFFIIGYLTYTGIKETMAYYLTVDEVLAQGPGQGNRGLRVGGGVIPGSVRWDPRELQLSFRIGDDRSSILVSYQGVVPDSFQPGKGGMGYSERPPLCPDVRQNMNDRANDIIEVKELTKRFGHKTALQRVNFSLRKAEFLALFGPNGAGKTTLIRILSSLMRPTSGEVLIAGQDVRKDGGDLRRIIGVISDQNFLYDHLTAYENLRFYGLMFDVKNLNKRIEELLERVGLRDRSHDRIHTFSRGMQQRLSISRALLHDPSVLLLDEPFSGLDREGVEVLKEILGDHKERGFTTVMTSHDLEKSLEICSRVAILKSGVMVFNEEVSRITRRNFQQLYCTYTESKAEPVRSWT
jgi:heme exporter protein A